MTQPGYTRGEVFLNNLASFWRLIFSQPEVVQGLLDNHEETLAQAYFNLLEIVLAKSVHDIPVFHREKWKLLTFLESDRNANASSLLRYGGGLVYGPQPLGSEFGEGVTYAYGGTVSGTGSSFLLPEGMVGIESYITNRIVNPSLVLTRGVDFQIKNGVLVFRENPFDNDLVPVRNIQDEAGAVVDREIALWALNSDHDYQFLWKNYGHLIDLFLESSENYKQFLRAAWSLFNLGPRIKFLESTLNALLGLPTVLEATEVVVEILTEGATKKVVTDRNVYEFDVDVPLRGDLEAGLELEATDPLTSVVTILDNLTTPGWWNNFAFLPIPKRILTDGHFDDLVVFNRSDRVPLVWGGSAPIQVGGDMTPERLEVFEEFPLLWGIDASWGDATFSYSGLDLLFEHFFKHHLFLLQINLNHVSADRLTSKVVQLLRDALPSYVFYIALNDVELTDEYSLDEDADDLEFDFEKAHFYEDDYDSYEEGFQSLTPLLAGFDTATWEDPTDFLWGVPGFHGGGPRWYIRPKPCDE